MNASDLRLIDYELAKLRDQIMSAMSEKLDAAAKSQDEMVRRVTDHLAAQNAELAELRKSMTTPEDIARVDSIIEKNKGLDPTDPTTLPPDGVPVDANPGGVPAGGETAPAAGA
jgi:hypothetical protein